jgi:hypothetical protein
MMRYHPFSHAGLKVVSVALAVLLWVMVSSQRASVERGLRIPLELQNLPENLEMVEPPQESVDVRVRGTADALGRIAPGDLVATVDLSSAQSGRRLFHIAPEPGEGAVCSRRHADRAIIESRSGSNRQRRGSPVQRRSRKPRLDSSPAGFWPIRRPSKWLDPRRASTRDGRRSRAVVDRISESRCPLHGHHRVADQVCGSRTHETLL